jgi:hypothetical protein
MMLVNWSVVGWISLLLGSWLMSQILGVVWAPGLSGIPIAFGAFVCLFTGLGFLNSRLAVRWGLSL